MKYKINLLPPPQLSVIDKTVYFSYNYLRYILVLTQLIVLAVFTYRFSVDQQIVDLKDSLRQKQEIVKVSSPLLQQGATIDDKILHIKNIMSDQDSFNQMIAYYLSVFPEKVTATNITVEKGALTLRGATTDLTIIQSFYKRLLQDNKFKDLKLQDIEKTETGYTFTLLLSSYQS